MKAIIRLEVPEYQTGKEVSCYFKDTMSVNGICENAEPCGDCISLEAVKNTMFMVQRTAFISDNEFHRTMDLLMRLPSVTPAEKVGHWYKKPHEICYTCDQCRTTNASGVKYNFCPHCGAKMASPTEAESEE